MPKVSVIVPIYNAEQYLDECLSSILRQTLKDIEIICVNDGSTDSSIEIINKYKRIDERISVIDKENAGYGHSMNCGLDAARGDFIGIVEADDYIDHDSYEILYNTAIEQNVEVVKANFYKYFSQQKKNEYTKVLPFNQYNKLVNPRENTEIFRVLPCIWAGIYKRELINSNRIRFTETPGASYQDTAFNFKIWACANRVWFLDRAFLHYRQDNENSSVKSKAKIYSVCDEYHEIESFLNLNCKEGKGLITLKNAIKYRAYRWNYYRLTDDARLKFLSIFSSEFRREMDEGNLDEKQFSEADWRDLNDIFLVNNTSAIEHSFNETKRLLNQTKQELNNLKLCPTFIIGCIIVFFPRMIYRLIKCLKENGITYTLSNFKKKIKKSISFMRNNHPKLYWKIRNIIIPPIFSYRSDMSMHARILICTLLKKIHLDKINKRMQLIGKYKGIHEGKRCFIVATGPSLTYSDLESLKNEYTFSVNSIFLLLENTDWRPTYYVFVDAYGYKTLSKQYGFNCGDIPSDAAFIHYRIKPKTLTGKERFCLIHYGNHTTKRMKHKEIKNHPDPAVCIYDAFTVTNMAIDLAIYMGFKEIYLVGVDCDYQGSKRHVVETEIDKKRISNMKREVELMLTGYAGKKDLADRLDVGIFNATRGGKLEIFPRVSLDDILGRNAYE